MRSLCFAGAGGTPVRLSSLEVERALLYGCSRCSQHRSALIYSLLASLCFLFLIESDPVLSENVAEELTSTGRWEVYVRSFPGLGDLHEISTSGGTHPRWRRDGKEMFYLAPDRMLRLSDLRNGANMQPSTPRPLFRVSIGPSVVPINERTLDAVAADGQRVLVATPLEGTGPQAITVATDWRAIVQAR